MIIEQWSWIRILRKIWLKKFQNQDLVATHYCFDTCDFWSSHELPWEYCNLIKTHAYLWLLNDLLQSYKHYNKFFHMWQRNYVLKASTMGGHNIYLKNHCTNTKLVCTHLNALFMLRFHRTMTMQFFKSWSLMCHLELTCAWRRLSHLWTASWWVWYGWDHN